MHKRLMLQAQLLLLESYNSGLMALSFLNTVSLFKSIGVLYLAYLIIYLIITATLNLFMAKIETTTTAHECYDDIT